MKLYATITSERATKGQGGNNFLEILFYGENKKLLPWKVNLLKYRPNPESMEGYMIEVSYNNSREWADTFGVYPNIRSHSKAKRQKGENEKCISCNKTPDIFGRCKCCNKDAF